MALPATASSTVVRWVMIKQAPGVEGLMHDQQVGFSIWASQPIEQIERINADRVSASICRIRPISGEAEP
jgi:hypothetical protein